MIDPRDTAELDIIIRTLKNQASSIVQLQAEAGTLLEPAFPTTIIPPPLKLLVREPLDCPRSCSLSEGEVLRL